MSIKLSQWNFGRAVFPTALTVFSALMPKCPLCFLLLSSVIGVNLTVNSAWLHGATLVFLLAAIFLIYKQARRARDLRPLIVALLAAAAIYAGKFYLDMAVPVYLGGAVLFAVSLWQIAARNFTAKAKHMCACGVNCRCGPDCACEPISKINLE